MIAPAPAHGVICQEVLDNMQDPLAVRVWLKWIKEGSALLVSAPEMIRFYRQGESCKA